VGSAPFAPNGWAEAGAVDAESSVVSPAMDVFPPMRVANATQLTDQLWIGGDLETSDTGQVTALAIAQLDEIEAAGITDILDLRLEWNDQSWVETRKPKLRYHWLGVDDAGQQMPDEWFTTGTRIVLDSIAAGGRVLAHCHKGVNRSPSMGFAVLLCQGHPAIAALELIRQRRPVARIGYAEDAMDWWLRSQGADALAREQGRIGIEAWRLQHELERLTGGTRTRVKWDL
jgi:dual specificity phosphatase 3